MDKKQKSEYDRLRYLNNRDKLIKQNREYRENNKEKVSVRSRVYYESHKNEHAKLMKKWYINNLDKHKKYGNKWRAENKDKIKEYVQNRRKFDKIFLLSELLRDRLRKALKNNYKSGSAVHDLGCSIDTFKNYLESKFLPGMNWGNHGVRGWHIDHIVPLSSFNLENREQFLRACHYTNMQPLWSVDNIRKGGWSRVPTKENTKRPLISI